MTCAVRASHLFSTFPWTPSISMLAVRFFYRYVSGCIAPVPAASNVVLGGLSRRLSRFTPASARRFLFGSANSIPHVSHRPRHDCRTTFIAFTTTPLSLPLPSISPPVSVDSRHALPKGRVTSAPPSHSRPSTLSLSRPSLSMTCSPSSTPLQSTVPFPSRMLVLGLCEVHLQWL